MSSCKSNPCAVARQRRRTTDLSGPAVPAAEPTDIGVGNVMAVNDHWQEPSHLISNFEPSGTATPMVHGGAAGHGGARGGQPTDASANHWGGAPAHNPHAYAYGGPDPSTHR